MGNESEQLETQALFPLHTVLFPGSILQLKIFEQRYLDLVKTCMKSQQGFVVTLIREGNEVDDTPTIHTIGTYVEIIDFERLDNGLLGITIQAKHKVRIQSTTAQHDGLLNGTTELISDDENTLNDDTEPYQHLSDMLETLVEHPLLKNQYADIDYHSLTEISYRLSEFLPTSNINKQGLLEITRVQDRLDKIDELIEQLQA